MKISSAWKQTMEIQFFEKTFPHDSWRCQEANVRERILCWDNACHESTEKLHQRPQHTSTKPHSLDPSQSCIDVSSHAFGENPGDVLPVSSMQQVPIQLQTKQELGLRDRLKCCTKKLSELFRWSPFESNKLGIWIPRLGLTGPCNLPACRKTRTSSSQALSTPNVFSTKFIMVQTSITHDTNALWFIIFHEVSWDNVDQWSCNMYLNFSIFLNWTAPASVDPPWTGRECFLSLA